MDNFVFARDAVVVVAAGNSPLGQPPNTPYPRHVDDSRWALGTWPRSFNALTCGAAIDRLSANGVATEIGAPSPFTKIGPGLCESPKPDFAASGGNGSAQYSFAPGMGVWCCTADGLWEDRSGTSYAAPLLAREAAFAFRNLQRVCEAGARPYGVTVKAFLALTATRTPLPKQLWALAERTLGRGNASARRLSSPNSDSAIIVWQGILDGPDDLARVQMPIPRQWWATAKNPRLRLIVAWDTPVNAAVESNWSCRKVSAQLRTELNALALHGSRSGHRSYPWIDRVYNLRKTSGGQVPSSDSWVLELNYQQLSEYYPGIDFTPQQRVAFAAELFDDSPTPFSPQALLQALPAAATMIRLSVPPTAVRNPVIIRTRI